MFGEKSTFGTFGHFKNGQYMPKKGVCTFN